MQEALKIRSNLYAGYKFWRIVLTCTLIIVASENAFAQGLLLARKHRPHMSPRAAGVSVVADGLGALYKTPIDLTLVY